MRSTVNGRDDLFRQSKRLEATGTGTLKIGVGRLHRVVVNQPGGSLTIFDSATPGSGTILLELMASGGASRSVEYGLDYAVGLSYDVVLPFGDLTIVYE